MSGNNGSARTRAYFLYSANPPGVEAPRNLSGGPDEVSIALVTELWNADLATLPSVFDRLVFLANLREDDNGGYRHYGLELALGGAAGAVISASHEAMFQEWLALPLEQQHADLTSFLSGAPGYRRIARASWSVPDRHIGLFPDSAASYERALYLADLDVIFTLLECQENGGHKASAAHPLPAKSERPC